MENKKTVFSEEIIEFSKLIDKMFGKIAKDVGLISGDVSIINNYVDKNDKTSKITIIKLRDIDNKILKLNNSIINFTGKLNEVNKKLKKNTDLGIVKTQLQTLNDRIKVLEVKLKLK